MVRAHNYLGWGDYSNVNTVVGTIKTVPTTMSALVEGSGSTST